MRRFLLFSYKKGDDAPPGMDAFFTSFSNLEDAIYAAGKATSIWDWHIFDTETQTIHYSDGKTRVIQEEDIQPEQGHGRSLGTAKVEFEEWVSNEADPMSRYSIFVAGISPVGAFAVFRATIMDKYGKSAPVIQTLTLAREELDKKIKELQDG